MTLSLLRKRYFGASFASRAIKHKQPWLYWQMGKIGISSLRARTDDKGFYLLRSWILRKMKKMRIAMRTIAIPAPITIPTILRESKKEGALTFHTQFQQIQIYSPKCTSYTCYSPQTTTATTMHFLQREANIDISNHVAAELNAPCWSVAPPPQKSWSY